MLRCQRADLPVGWTREPASLGELEICRRLAMLEALAYEGARHELTKALAGSVMPFDVVA